MTARAARVAAQAKVNLFLRILATERSGYHQLETLFARLELADEITVRVVARGRSVDVKSDQLPLDRLGTLEENLALRAADVYRAAAGWPDGFALELEKRIPLAGGLGGGSADAGAVLRALNRLSPRPLPPWHLLDLARTLGSDVPFLTSESAMTLAWGRGERMLHLPAPPAADAFLLFPPFGVPTREAYTWLDDEPPEARSPAAWAADPASLRSWPGIAALSHNDFERVVFARHPSLRLARDSLAACGARIARLSGSGGTVFGVFDRGAPTGLSIPQAISEGWRMMRTRTADRVVEVQLID